MKNSSYYQSGLLAPNWMKMWYAHIYIVRSIIGSEQHVFWVYPIHWPHRQQARDKDYGLQGTTWLSPWYLLYVEQYQIHIELCNATVKFCTWYTLMSKHSVAPSHLLQHTLHRSRFHCDKCGCHCHFLNVSKNQECPCCQSLTVSQIECKMLDHIVHDHIVKIPLLRESYSTTKCS